MVDSGYRHYAGLSQEYSPDNINPVSNHVVVDVNEYGKIIVKLVKVITKWAPKWVKARREQHVLFYVASGIRIVQTDSFFRKMGMTPLEVIMRSDCED